MLVKGAPGDKHTKEDTETLYEDRIFIDGRHIWVNYVVYKMKWCMYCGDELFMRSINCFILSFFVAFRYLRNSGNYIWGVWAPIEDDPSQWDIHTNIRIKLIEIFYFIAL